VQWFEEKKKKKSQLRAISQILDRLSS